jgi:hypothetical protein
VRLTVPSPGSGHGLDIAASAKARTRPSEDDAAHRWIDFSLSQLLLECNIHGP